MGKILFELAMLILLYYCSCASAASRARKFGSVLATSRTPEEPETWRRESNMIWSWPFANFHFDNDQIQYLYNIWYSVDNQIEIKKKMSCTNCLFQIHLKSLFAFCCCQHGVLHRHISQPWVLLHLSTLAKAPNTWGWSGSGGQGLVHVL